MRQNEAQYFSILYILNGRLKVGAVSLQRSLLTLLCILSSLLIAGCSDKNADDKQAFAAALAQCHSDFEATAGAVHPKIENAIAQRDNAPAAAVAIELGKVVQANQQYVNYMLNSMNALALAGSTLERLKKAQAVPSSLVNDYERYESLIETNEFFFSSTEPQHFLSTWYNSYPEEVVLYTRIREQLHITASATTSTKVDIYPNVTDPPHIVNQQEPQHPEKMQPAAASYVKGNVANAVAYYNRGTEEMSHNDFQHALRDLSKAIELNPNIDFAYFNRGLVKKATGDVEGALADFSAALKLNPSNPKYQKNIHAIFEELRLGKWTPRPE